MWTSFRIFLPQSNNFRDGFNTTKPILMRILFIEIQWHGIILAPMCLCQGKMWKSKVKNIFISFPTLACRSEATPRSTQVSLLAQSLKTHQQWKYSYISNSMLLSSVFVKHGVLCKKYEEEWRQISNSHDLRPTKYRPISAVNSDLCRRYMPARLDDPCPYSYFCLNPIVAHRKTYVLMFCNT